MITSILASLGVALFLATATGSGVLAQDFQKGYQAYQKNDYQAAMREWRTPLTHGCLIVIFLVRLISLLEILRQDSAACRRRQKQGDP